MKLGIIIFLLTLLCSQLRADEIVTKKAIAFDTFTLPKSLVDWNYQLIRHGMDVVLNDNQLELTFGDLPAGTNSLRLSLTIIEFNQRFFGEVRLFDLKEKKYFAVVPLEFSRDVDAVENVRIAITEAILGREYAKNNLFDIREKAKVKYSLPKGQKAPKVNIADENTELESKEFQEISKAYKNLKAKQIKKNGPKKNEKLVPKKKVSKIQENNKSQLGNLKDGPATEKVNETPNKPNIDLSKSNPLNPDKSARDLKEETKRKFQVDGFLFGGQMQIVTEKNVKVTTTIGHIGVGARVRLTDLVPKDIWQYSLELQIARPTKRDDYSIPLWRKIDFTANKTTKFNFFKYGFGSELEPLYFIALPVYGAGLTVIDNNILWVSALGEFRTERWADKHTLNLKLSRSLVTMGSDSIKLSGFKINLYLHNSLSEIYSLDFNFQRSFLSDGENAANNQLLTTMLRYNF